MTITSSNALLFPEILSTIGGQSESANVHDRIKPAVSTLLDQGGQDDLDYISLHTTQQRIVSAIEHFRSHLKQKGYEEIDSVGLASGVDPSVLFIGSHISVMKPWLLGKEIPGSGLFMHQPCIRTRNTDSMFDDTKIAKWGSYFPSIGSLVKPENLLNACEDAFQYLVYGIGIKHEDILLRVSSRDIDLLHAIGETGFPIRLEIDSRHETYYQHKLGIADVSGRNFNIAIRNQASGVYNDIGNIIIIENKEKTLAVETAIGVTTLICESCGLENFFETSIISHLVSKNDGLYPKLKDCIVSSVAIMREGVLPVATNRGRILRKYLRGLIYLRQKLGLRREDIVRIVSQYEILEFETNIVAPLVQDYIESYELSLQNKLDLSKEDEIIHKVLYPITT